MIGKGWVRTRINQEIDRIRRCFRWGVAEELVTAVHAEALRAVQPLAKGRSDAPESPEVMPVAEADYLATLPFLPPCPRAIVELMRVTGMRPGEACGLIWGEIDRSGEVWRHKPKHHKNAHRGQDRTIAIGSRGQAVILGCLAGHVPTTTEHVFDPMRARAV